MLGPSKHSRRIPTHQDRRCDWLLEERTAALCETLWYLAVRLLRYAEAGVCSANVGLHEYLTGRTRGIAWIMDILNAFGVMMAQAPPPESLSKSLIYSFHPLGQATQGMRWLSRALREVISGNCDGEALCKARIPCTYSSRLRCNVIG